MKINVNDLIRISACNSVIEYYRNKYGNKSKNLWQEYKKAKLDWKVWLLGCKDLKIVKYLIANGTDINISDSRGSTAVIHASGYGHLEIVKYLIDNGANINTQNNYGRTALMWASCGGYLEVVKYLIVNGADVNMQDKDGWAAVIWASYNGYLDMTKYLEEIENNKRRFCCL